MAFIVFILIPIGIGLWAQAKVQSAYQKWVQVPSKNHMTGRDAAAAILQAAGAENVGIVEIPGQLTDHYDPSRKLLALSSANYNGTSLAALGVAAHEAGHALQDQQHYLPLKLRSVLIPATTIASKMLPFVLFGGFIFPFLGAKLIPLAIGVYLVLAVFQLVTLPVEFDASRRAKHQLTGLGILQPDEMLGVHKTLDAAAYTYVAAFVSSLGWLLYYLGVSRD